MSAETASIISGMLDRARIYSLISGLFSDPDLQAFRMLTNPELRAEFMASCDRLHISDDAVPIFALLNHEDLQRIKEEYVRVFGHTLSKDTSPYELEFSKSKEVFALTQALSDITGFYSAFGLLLDATERVDHIAIEAEFLCFLLLKEAMAIENHLPEEKTEVCRNARRDFGRDHFFWWALPFAETLMRQPESPFYNSAGELLKRFIELEKPQN